MKTLYLVDPPRKLTLEGFPGCLSQMKLWVEREVDDLEVKILDLSTLDRDEDNINQNLAKIYFRDGDYFGITATTATYQSGLAVARALKRLNRSVTVILGGHHVKEAQAPSKGYLSLNWEPIRSEASIVLEHHPEIDMVALGEGERTLVDLLSGKSLENVRGITYRGTSGIIKNPLAPRLSGSDLDTISVTNFDEESLAKMTQFGNINYISATGCPLACAFCSVGREKIESKSLSRKIDELQYLVQKFPSVKDDKRISIQDNFFGKSARDTRALCEAIVAKHKKNPEFYFNWDCQTRVESMTDKTLTDLMKQSGCVAVYLGIENFSEEVLRYMNKAHNVKVYLECASKSISNLLNSGIDVYLEYQTGMPIETEKHRTENIKALTDIGKIAAATGRKISVFMSLSVIYPATNHSYQMFESGVPRDAFEVFTKWEDQQEKLRQYISKNFGHGSGGIPTGIMDMEAFKNGIITIFPDRITKINAYFDRIGKIPGIICYYQS